MTRRSLWVFGAAAALLFGAGCYRSHQLAPDDGGPDSSETPPFVADGGLDFGPALMPGTVEVVGTLTAPRLFPSLLDLEGRVVIAAGAGFEGSEPLPLDVFDPSTGEIGADPSLPSGPVGAGYFIDRSGLGFAGGLGYDPALAPTGLPLEIAGRIRDGAIVPMDTPRSAAGWPLVSTLDGRALVVSGYVYDADAELLDSGDDARWLSTAGRWETFAVAGPQGRPRGACVSLGSAVYFSGGIGRPEGSSGANASVREISVGASGRLVGRHIARMSIPRAGHVMLATGETELTVLGGVFQDRSRPPIEDRLPYADLPPITGVERNDIAGGDYWLRIEPLPYPLAFMAGFQTPSGALVLIGGTSEPLSRGRGRSELLVRDPGAETWRTVESGLVPRYAHGIFVLDDGSVLIAGGLSAPGEPVFEVERLRF